MRVGGPGGSTRRRLLGGPPWRYALAVWIGVFLFINLTTGNLMAGTTLRQYRLATQGRSTTGTVTALEPSDHAGCTFVYQVAGVQYSRYEEACGHGRTPAGDDPQVGSVLSVTYIADDPGKATTTNAKFVFWQGIALVLGAPTLLAAVTFLAKRRYAR